MVTFIARAVPRLGPRPVTRTGDDTPAQNVFGYIWRMTGWQQVAVCLFAILIAPLNLAPVELQRRIVDDIVVAREVDPLILLGLIYVGVVIGHQFAKFGLRIAQSWLAESAIIYTRRHLLELFSDRPAEARRKTGGQAVSVIVPEIDKLGEFAGTGPSQAAANLTTLILIIGYMIYMEPKIGLVSLAFLLPQTVLIPIVQRHLNVLTRRRLDLLRTLGDAISDSENDQKDSRQKLLPRIYRNKMTFNAIKFAMKGAQNALTVFPVVAILIFGGYLVLEGQTTIGIVVAFMSGYERTTGPFRELIVLYRTAAQANVQHAKIAQWM